MVLFRTLHRFHRVACFGSNTLLYMETGMRQDKGLDNSETVGVVGLAGLG